MSVAWPSEPLGDVCEIYQPKTISQKEMVDDGQYPVFGANGIIGRYDKFNHEAPQLLITCRGATCGSVNVSAPFSWVTGNAMVVRPKNGKLDLKFTEYFFRGAIDLNGVITGAAQPQITRQSLAPVTIPLPPLAEQRRIVAKLNQAFTALDRAHAHAEANLADAEALFEDTLNALFAGLADNGNVVTLTDAVHPDCKLSYGIVQPGDEVEGGLAVVRPVDLKQRIITLDGVKTIDPAHADGYARTKLVGGELLLCVRGSTGEISVASQELEGANVTRGIVPIRFETDKVDPEFAYFQMRSRYVRDQILAKTYGAALMQINIKDLRQLNFVVPPLDLQRKATIAAEKLFEHSQTMIEGYQAKLTDLADLRQSLLQRAFSGQL